ncbi:MAG: ABC transporter ATP-binding protein [Chloroflexi bacterium]|nr:ABC transporter ATP-binding protein [Chloroflexota bacterium]
MIRLERLTKHYGETPAVEDLSFEVMWGEVCVLIGPSGCGKTTTLRMINRLIEPTSGKIFIDDRDISQIKPEQLRRTIGYAIQSVGLFPHLTVAKNIAVVPELLHWAKDNINNRVGELLALVGLGPQYAAKYPSQLSGGEAQRVGVARALAADPPILLMDEPFGAVDPMTRERLQEQFVTIQQKLKKTVILVTHDLDEAIRLADRIAIMKSGKLVQYDAPETLLAHPADKFVHDFVGADRALKRLSRISVRSLVKTVSALTENMSAEEAMSLTAGKRWAWVVDDSGQLIGWVDQINLIKAISVSRAMVRGSAREIAVSSNATLREALSRMLGQAFKYLPVVDDSGCLIGEVSLSDVEQATVETET